MIKKEKLIELLKRGKIGVMPTDTIYGLVGLALDRGAVERIYSVRRRRPDKPLIVLVSSLDDLKKFGVKLDSKAEQFLSAYWPGQVSVILPCLSDKYRYLHRGTKTLAFRLPNKRSIQEVLRITGPLVAPSANPEGLPPASDLIDAKKYFGDKVDFYFGRGELKSPASTLVRITRGKVKVIRPGAVVIND